MAGGLDTFDWLKDRTKRTERGGRPEPGGGAARDQGSRTAASRSARLTPLTEVVKHPVVREKFGLLMEAADLVASPQIRNQGTLGGNISQDTRCWYYRSGWSCYRAGGNICYADTPTAINREHAILRRGPLRGGEPVGHGAGADCAGRGAGDPAARAASGW